ncbi:unnamed protein product [Rhodiola kirilowii]
MGDRFRKTEQILQSSKIWKDAQTSPERNRVWTEPQPADVARRLKRVSVVYYLSRNGHLEHPHFMEVPLSCPDGLYLKDVINRLNLLRGKSLASIYSWSSKRSYKNGFVWHDLSEDDYIHPVHGLEYVLKGSEILLLPHPQPTSHIHECKVYNAEPERQLDGKCVGAGADASTQTEDKRRRSKLVSENENEIVEVEGSPPPVDSSSPETLESLMKADKRLTMVTKTTTTTGNTNEEMQSGRLKASSVLMQLITCGSFSFRDCGTDEHHGMSQQQKVRDEESHVKKEVEALMEMESISSRFEMVRLEDKEYFSGSVIETQRKELEFPSLKRSSSYNADRVFQSELELAEKQDMWSDSVRGKCIPRKTKASLINSATKKETPNDVVLDTDAKLK